SDGVPQQLDRERRNTPTTSAHAPPPRRAVCAVFRGLHHDTLARLRTRGNSTRRRPPPHQGPRPLIHCSASSRIVPGAFPSARLFTCISASMPRRSASPMRRSRSRRNSGNTSFTRSYGSNARTASAYFRPGLRSARATVNGAARVQGRWVALARQRYPAPVPDEAAGRDPVTHLHDAGVPLGQRAGVRIENPLGGRLVEGGVDPHGAEQRVPHVFLEPRRRLGSSITP